MTAQKQQKYILMKSEIRYLMIVSMKVFDFNIFVG